jgi:hypothetical protein
MTTPEWTPEELRAVIERQNRKETTEEEDILVHMYFGASEMDARFWVGLDRGTITGDTIEIK